jgi:hypothetical protein
VATVAAIGLFALSAASIAAQDATATPAASPTVTVTPEPDAPRLELEFEELNDSGVSGTATLYEAGDRTIVELDLEDTGENHPAHIHAGSCDDLQPEPEYPLENVGSDGRSTSVVDASLDELIDGDFAIDLHLAPNELGTLIVCADIEGEPEVPAAAGTPQARPAATPEGTADLTPETPDAPERPDPTAGATEVATEDATGTTATLAEAATRAATAAVSEAASVIIAERPVSIETPVAAEATEPADGTGGAESTIIPTEGATEEVTEAAETPATTEIPDEPEPTAAPAETATEDATAPADGTGGAINDSADSASVPLASTSDLGVTATAVLTALDEDTTRISVVLSGDAVTGDHIVHLHGGTCDQPGDVTLDLDPIDAASVSETDVDLSLDELLADGYFINVHRPDAAYDTWLVCGDLSAATVGMVAPEVAPETETRDQRPVVEATTAPTDEPPVAEATTAPEVETPAAVPTAAPVNVAGDGTSGDVAESGKGSPVDPTTGLPETTGTGPLRTGDDPLDRAFWLSSALALVSLAAALWIRRADSRRSISRHVPHRTRLGI